MSWPGGMTPDLKSWFGFIFIEVKLSENKVILVEIKLLYFPQNSESEDKVILYFLLFC